MSQINLPIAITVAAEGYPIAIGRTARRDVINILSRIIRHISIGYRLTISLPHPKNFPVARLVSLVKLPTYTFTLSATDWLPVYRLADVGGIKFGRGNMTITNDRDTS